ncbi:MAG: hypothetical protein LBT73_01870 [Tannerellaceae bacterium]|jgi:hypothetical protein|nr:hypothetical protein [Tannerellaceae bacterium]
MKPHLPVVIAIVLWAVVGCEGFEEKYALGTGYRLSFSADTLSFDTLFSAVASPTRTLMVYNRYDRALDIASIRLERAGQTGFRINVDGRKGTYFEHVSLRSGDSLYILVEVTLPSNDSPLPQLTTDHLSFVLNGQSQSVRLEAYGQDVTLLRGGHTFRSDTTLLAERPFLIHDSLVVAAGATLRLTAGTTFYLHDRANLVIRGTLIAEGTGEDPITLRGDRLDYVLTPILLYDSEPAQWGGITFHPTSSNNVLCHTLIRNSSSGLAFLPSSPEASDLILSHCQLTNTDGNLLDAVNWKMEISDTELTNAAGTVVRLAGGNYQFIHCTIANHFLFGRSDTASYALSLSNQQSPLDVSFDNCLIDGRHGSGLELSFEETHGIPFEYRFNHCVIKANADSLSAHQSDCIFITESPLYRKRGRTEDKYTFDFRLDTLTAPGVGKADPDISVHYPVDRYGVSRLDGDNAPTIGAYEFDKE